MIFCKIHGIGKIVSMEYNIIRNKVVKIEFNNVSKTFFFRIKRAFTVFTSLLDRYPDWMDIHELDTILGDPNRAISDLKNDDGYQNFLNERRGTNRNNEYIINLEKLFNHFSEIDKVSLSVETRKSPSSNLKNHLKEKFESRCNITNLRLYEKLPAKSFMKNLQMIQYDHRIPLFKGGDHDPNSPSNWQLLSELVNREKNKSCNACEAEGCETCALAFPEDYDTILSNNQDISNILITLKK
jgi:hypothetical protein